MVRELSRVFAFGPVIDRGLIMGSSITGYASNSLSTLFKRHPMAWITNTIRPKSLVYIPTNLHDGQADVAEKIYRGCYPFAGISPELGGQSPFAVMPPSQAWERELLSFSWLNDLAAGEGEIIKSLARALTQDWIAAQGGGHKVAWRPEITSQRLLNWLANADMLLSGLSKTAYVNIMRSIGRQLHDLEANIHKAPDGPHRLCAACTLIIASLSLSGLEGLQKRSIKVLNYELNRQILVDGGHLSRNPEALVETLGILLPTKLCFIDKGQPIPQALITAIDRIFPMIRFFLHGDGGLACFNGVTKAKTAEIKKYFEHDETKGRPFSYAPHSGYHRLEAGQTTLFLDAGGPPPTSVSHHAHAGCLSMELSDGPHRIVVNCGASDDESQPLYQAARTTAAHSTLTINERSSARLLEPGRLARLIGSPLLAGGFNVGSQRSQSEEGFLLEAAHNGYGERYGIHHRRHIFLSANGDEVRGEDRLSRIQQRRRLLAKNDRDIFTLRFHLHPKVNSTPTRNGRQIFLIMADKSAWVFSVLGGEVSIEESIYLLDRTTQTKTRQLVIHGAVEDRTMVKWAFKKIKAERNEKQDAMATIQQEIGLPFDEN